MLLEIVALASAAGIAAGVIRRHRVLSSAWARAVEDARGARRSFSDIFKRVFPVVVPSTAETAVRQQNRDGGLRANLPGALTGREPRDLGLDVAIGEAAVTGYGLLSGFLAVDGDFCRAISELAGHNITSFSDLHAQIGEYSGSIWSGVSEGVVTKVQGHVAEQIVADHLRQLGHHVEFAPASNTASYDLIVDHDYLINVKDHVSMAGVHAHLAAHPDVSAIVPAGLADHADGTIDAAHGIDGLHQALDHSGGGVIADAGLDHDAVVGHTHSALDFLTGHVDVHIPWITLVRSTVREAELLISGATELERAARNIVCDAVGTGVGGALGAKAGALIGTVLAPGIGTGVVGILGFFAGAWGGRFMSNCVKYAPLKEAQEAYSTAREELVSGSQSIQADAEREYAVEVREAEQSLERLAREARTRIDRAVSLSRGRLSAEAGLTGDEEARLLYTTRAGLRNELEEARRRARALPIWRIVWPDAHAAQRLATWRLCAKRAAEFERAVDAEVTSSSKSAEQAERLFDLALALGYGVSECESYLARLRKAVEKARAQIITLAKQESERVSDARAERIRALEATAQRLAASVEERMRPLINRAKEREAALRREMASFGVSM
jgi:hypothetical protein